MVPIGRPGDPELYDYKFYGMIYFLQIFWHAVIYKSEAFSSFLMVNLRGMPRVSNKLAFKVHAKICNVD